MNLEKLYLLKINDIFIYIQFVIPLFMIDNFHFRKEELLRYNKNYLLIAFEKIVIAFLMVFIIRSGSLLSYELIIYNQITCFWLIGRFVLVDFGSLVFCYICANLFLNKYIGMIISFVLFIVLRIIELYGMRNKKSLCEYENYYNIISK